MAAEYRKLPPEVAIIQDAIPESVYGQWMTTQLMGGTAPDIIDVGLGVPFEELQEYMLVPLAQFGIRIFYNRDLLRRLTGRTEPPHNYQEFLAVCEQIQQQRDERGRPYLPIAASQYHVTMWEDFMANPRPLARYAKWISTVTARWATSSCLWG